MARAASEYSLHYCVVECGRLLAMVLINVPRQPRKAIDSDKQQVTAARSVIDSSGLVVRGKGTMNGRRSNGPNCPVINRLLNVRRAPSRDVIMSNASKYVRRCQRRRSVWPGHQGSANVFTSGETVVMDRGSEDKTRRTVKRRTDSRPCD
jgi:hypothetical protein